MQPTLSICSAQPLGSPAANVLHLTSTRTPRRPLLSRMTRRNDRGPSVVGQLTELSKSKNSKRAASSVFAERNAQPVPASDDDSEYEDELMIMSQQSQAERLFGSQSTNAGSSNATATTAAPADAPKRRQRRHTASPKNAPSTATATPRKRANESEITPQPPQRTSKRIASKDKKNYRDPGDHVEMTPIANDDDEDFQNDSGTPSSGRAKKQGRKRGRPQKLVPHGAKTSTPTPTRGSALKLNLTPKFVPKKPSSSSSPASSLPTVERRETKWALERDRGCNEEELSMCMALFRDTYTQPGSNAQIADWFRKEHFRDATYAELDEIFRVFVKPWGDKYNKLKDDFGVFVNTAKSRKKKYTDPRVTKNDAKKWFDEFFQINGPLPVPDMPKRFCRKPEPEQEAEAERPKRRRLSRRNARSSKKEATDTNETEAAVALDSPVAVKVADSETRTTPLTRSATRRLTRSAAKAKKIEMKVEDGVDDEYEDDWLQKKDSNSGEADEDNDGPIVDDDKKDEELREDVDEKKVVANVDDIESKAETMEVVKENDGVEDVEMAGEKRTEEPKEIPVIELVNETPESKRSMEVKEQVAAEADGEEKKESRARSEHLFEPFQKRIEASGFVGVLAVSIEVAPSKKGMLVDCHSGSACAVDAITKATADARK